MRHGDADWLFAAREQCHELARQMVRMEALANRFDAQGLYERGDAVRWDRDAVRRERSRLMREVWARRRVAVPAR